MSSFGQILDSYISPHVDRLNRCLYALDKMHAVEGRTFNLYALLHELYRKTVYPIWKSAAVQACMTIFGCNVNDNA